MKKYAGILLAFFIYHFASAQSYNPTRLEFPASKFTTELQCVLCHTNGLCMVYPSWSYDSAFANIQHYDVHLKLQNKIRVPIQTQYVCVETAYDNGCIYLLYQSKNKKKKEENGMLISYDLQKKEIDTLSLTHLPLNDINKFTAKNGCFLFTSPTPHDNSNIYFLAKGSHSPHALYLHNAPEYSIDDFLSDTLCNKHLVCLNTSAKTKDNVLWLCETTIDGEPIRYKDLPDTGDFRFQNARIAQLDTGVYLLSGTYQLRKSGLGNTATGIYSLLYQNGQFATPQLFPFNIIDVENAKHTRSDNDFDELLYLVSKIYTDGHHYALVAEGFYPEYRYSTTYMYGVPSTEPVFVGYRFTGAEVMLFDKMGNKIWNYNFPFNLLVSNLTTHLRVAYPNNQILLFYMQDKNIVTMLTDSELSIIDPIRSNPLLPSENNNPQSITTTGLSPWYDNYYILSGYQFKTGKSKSPVFFLNKLKYQ